MWIVAGDKFEIKNEVCEIVNIEGLYSSASNVKVVLKNKTNMKIEIPLLEFNSRYDNGEYKAVMIKPKLRQGA